MECPICHKPMEIYESKTTTDKHGKEYDHTRYRCRADDVWSRLEIPKQPVLMGATTGKE
jgi:hypothetical protein